MLCEGCNRFSNDFPLFSVFVWTGENDSNTLRVDVYFFAKTEEKISVSKVAGCVWPRLKMMFSGIFVAAHHLTYREAICRMCGVKLGKVFCSFLSCRN